MGYWQLKYVRINKIVASSGATPTRTYDFSYTPSTEVIASSVKEWSRLVTYDRTTWDGVYQGEGFRQVAGASGDIAEYTWANRNTYLPQNAIDYFTNNGFRKQRNTATTRIITATTDRRDYNLIPFIFNSNIVGEFLTIIWERTGIFVGVSEDWFEEFWYHWVEADYKLKPNYSDLITGYSRDTRKIPTKLTITSAIDLTVTVKHYQNNPYEDVPKLKSIDWVNKTINLKAGIPADYNCTGITLGTLQFTASVNATLNIINYVSNGIPYPLSALLNNISNLDALFVYWLSLYTANIGVGRQLVTPLASLSLSQIKLKVLAASNNYWNNNSLPFLSDRGAELNHPFFTPVESKIYEQHLEPQVDNKGIGSLVMDSIRTIEIHAALEASKYSTNELDTSKPRITTLGWHINRQSEVLGIRVNPNGKIDEALEKTTNRRLHVDGTAENDVQKYNPNCFGSEGMLVRILPNKFSPNGIVSGGYSKIKDIPQLLAEFHEQANAAVGYQEGTAIEINIDGQVYRYPNQLALLTELLVTGKQTVTYSKGAFFSSLVGEQSIKEVMGGLGLRTVDRFIEFKVAGKATKLYYKGISASQSIRRKLSAVATNVGIAIGNII